MIDEEQIKQKKYCNYCKHFKEYDTTVPQCSSGVCDARTVKRTASFIFARPLVQFYFNSCELYEYYPLKNMYGIESQNFIKDWRDANNIRIDLKHNIWEEQLPF